MLLGDRQAKQAKRLFRLLDRTQKEFCAEFDVSEAALSSALRRSRSTANDIWEKVLNGLEAELNKGTSKTEDLGAKTEARAMLDDLWMAFGKPSLEPLMPGDVIPLDSPLYIERPCDTQLREGILGKRQLFSVTGAPRSGRTSLLRRYARDAVDSGYDVFFMDLNEYRLRLPDMKRLDLFIEIAARLGIPEDLAEKDGDITRFVWRHLKERSGRAFLIVDNVDNAALISKDTVLQALDRLTIIKDEVPARKFVAVVAFGAEAWSSIFGSPFYTRSLPPVPTDSFDRNRVRQLAVLVLNREPKESELNEALNLFAGQPYLTHLFLEEIRAGKDLNKVRRDVLSFTGPFKYYADRIIDRMQTVCKDDSHLSYPSGFIKLCEEIVERKEGLLTDQLHTWLRLFGIKNQNNAVGELYRCRFEQRLKLLEKY